MKRFLSYLIAILLFGVLGLSESFAAAPTVQSRYVSLTSLGSQTANLSWIKGNGVARIVVLRDVTTYGAADWDAVRTALGANPDYSGNDDNGAYSTAGNPQVGATNHYVVDVITTSSTRTASLSGLVASRVYEVHVFEYNTSPSLAYYTVAGTMNPRAFTTLAGISTPTVALDTDFSTDGILGPYAQFDITGNNNDLITYEVDISDDNFATFESPYDDLDVGILSTGATETLLAYLPTAGTYKIRVRAKLGAEISSSSTPITFTISDVTPPTISSVVISDDNTSVTVTFSEEVTVNSDGTAGAINGGNFASILTISDDATATVTVNNPTTENGIVYSFDIAVSGASVSNARVYSTESLTFSQLTGNITIYDMNGNEMDVEESDYDTFNEATVVVDDGNNGAGTYYSYPTIADAEENAAQDDGIILKDGETYTESVIIDVYNLTIKDDDTGADAIIAGTITYDPEEGTAGLTISDIEMTSVGAPLSCVVVNDGILALYDNAIKYDDGDKAVYFVPGGLTNEHYIGEALSGGTEYPNYFTRYGNSTAAYAIYHGDCWDYNAATTLNISNNTFQNNTGAGLAGDACIYLNVNTDAGSPTALEIDDNTFAATVVGDAIFFAKGECIGTSPTFDPARVFENVFNNLGYAINFESGEDFTSVMPIIDLDNAGSGNTFDLTGTAGTNANSGFPSGFYYDEATVDAATLLFPGPVVLSSDNTLDASDDVYSTINLGYTALETANTDGYYLFVMDGTTYEENLTLDEDHTFTIQGKSTTAIIQGTWTVSGTDTETLTISSFGFDLTGEVTNAIAVASSPLGSTIDINDCSFDYNASDYAIYFETGTTVAGTVNIAGANGSNFFSKSYGVAADAAGYGIYLGDNQITGTLNIDANNFLFNSTGTRDAGIYINTLNTIGASTGTINITGNTFQGADIEDPAMYNGVGDAVLFDDFSDNDNAANNLAAATINIYNGNDFSQVGYAVKIEDYTDETFTTSIISTLPNTIDLWGTEVGNEDNNNLSGSEIYGAAWMNFTTDAVLTWDSKLYPSIQYVENINYGGTTGSIKIGRGVYDENVLVNNVDITGFEGNGTSEYDCDLASGKTLTLTTDLSLHSGFEAPTVLLTNAAAKLDDAHALVQAGGTIGLNADITVAGDLTITKRITVNGDYDNNATLGVMNGKFNLNASTGTTLTIKNFSWAGQDETNCIVFTGNTDDVTITDNVFETADGGTAILSNGRTLTNLTIGDEDNGNTFNFANANTNTAETGVAFLNSEMNAPIIAYNTFNMDGGSANSTAGRDYAIKVNVDNNISGGTYLTVNNNTFTSGGVDLSNTTAAYYTYDGENTFGYLENQRFNSNTFANDGYAFVFVNNGGTHSLCSFGGNSLTLGTGEFANTFTFGTENLVANPVLGAYYSPYPIDGTVSTITADCASPASFTTGVVLAYNGETANSGTAADYWNSHDTKIKVTVPLPLLTGSPDVSLVNGTIKVYATKTTDVTWAAQEQLGADYTILTADVPTGMPATAGSKTLEFSATELDALIGVEELATFADGQTWMFRAVLTDMAGNSTNGTGSADQLIVDQTPVAVAMTNPAQSSIINTSPQIQGTYTEAGSGLVRLEYTLTRSDDNTNGNYTYYYNKSNNTWTSETPVWNNVENINAPLANQWNDNFEPVLTENYYEWQVRGVDIAGNTSTVETPVGTTTYRAFRIDQTPPTVVSLTQNSTTEFLLTFSEEIQSSGAENESNYTITSTDGTFTLVTADRQDGANSNKVTLTINPATAFESCDLFTVEVVNIKDVAQNTIVNDANEDNIGTYQEPDVIAPWVVSVERYEANGTNEETALNSYLTNASTVTYKVTFSEAVGHVSLPPGGPMGGLPDNQELFALSADDFDLIGAGGALSTIASVTSSNVPGEENVVFYVVVNSGSTTDGDDCSVQADGSSIMDYGCSSTYGNLSFNQGAHVYTAQYYRLDLTAPEFTAGFFTAPTSTSYWKKTAKHVTWDNTKLTDGHTATTSIVVDFGYTLNSTAPEVVWADMFEGTTTANGEDYFWHLEDIAEITEAEFPNSQVRIQATDEAGNASDWFTSDNFLIDNLKPELVATTGVTVSKSLLNESDNATEFTITATFDENMDGGVAPTIALDPNPITGGTLTLDAPKTGWNVGVNKTVYTWTYDVADLNVNFDDIDITISTAQDLAGNVMDLDATYTNKFDIEMVAPTATVVLSSSNSSTNPNSYLINYETTTLTAELTFDEAMNPLVAPLLSFSAAIDNRINDESALGIWSLGNTVYTITYTVSNAAPGDAYMNASNYALTVTGAQDVAGNSMEQEDVNNIKADQVVPVITWRNAYQSTTGVNPGDKTDRWVKNGDHVYYEYTCSEAVGSYVNLLFRSPDQGGQDMFIPYDDNGTTVYGFYGIVNDENYPNDGNMTHKITVEDNAGNLSNTLDGNSINLAGNTPVVVDRVAPTVVSIVPDSDITAGDNTVDPILTSDNTVVFTVTFDNCVTGIDANDFALYTPGPDNDCDGSIGVVAVNCSTYTVTVSTVVGDGDLGLSVLTSVADMAGNTLAVQEDGSADTEMFEIDNTAPTVTEVVLNCLNQPTQGSLANRKATVSFSEPIYSNNNGTGNIVATNTSATDMLLTFTNIIGASVTTWGVSGTTGNAGTDEIIFDLTWTAGTIYGSEICRADFQATQVYDRAGNASAVVGSSTASNSASTNRELTVSTHPEDVLICGLEDAIFSASAEGDGNTFYTWQIGQVVGQDTTWHDVVDLLEPAQYDISLDGSTITINNVTYNEFNGAPFRYKVTNNCYQVYSNVATLSVVPDVVITEAPVSVDNCEASVNASFTVESNVDEFVGTTYQWQMWDGTLNGGLGGFANVANGTPANAVYTGATSTTLGITGNIAPGLSYVYRVAVTNSCANTAHSATSSFPACSLRVYELPNTALTVTATNGTVCYGTGTTITVANPEEGMTYTLMNGQNPVGDPVTYEEGVLSFSTGELTSQTTFTVKAQNIYDYDEELQQIVASCDVTLVDDATVSIEAIPVSGTLTKGSDVAQVCEGTDVSATLTAGSGGGVDVLEYSYNEVDWFAYTSGTPIETMNQSYVYIRTYRDAEQCDDADAYTVSWMIEETPDAEDVLVINHIGGSVVCEGTIVDASLDGLGTGGNGEWEFVYITSTNGGTSWSDEFMVENSMIQVNANEGMNLSEVETDGLTNVRYIFRRFADVCSTDVDILDILVNPLPTQYAVSTTPANGHYCESGNGVVINVADTEVGVEYYLQVSVEGWMPVLDGEENAYFINGTGSAISFAPQLNGIYRVYAINATTDCAIEMSNEVTIIEDVLPTVQTIVVDAGTGNETIGNSNRCQGTSFTIGLTNAEAGVTYTLKRNAFTHVSYTPANSGAFSFINPATTTTTFTEATNASYTVTASRSACTNIDMTGYLNVNPEPTANAGADAVICDNSGTYQLAATITNLDSQTGTIAWTTSGTGTFNSTTVEDPIYTPSLADIADEGVTLTLTVTNPGCSAVQNSMELSIAPNYAAPTVSITSTEGNDVCFGEGTVFTATPDQTNIDFGGTLSYTWYKNGNSVAGVTGNEYTLANVSQNDAIYCVLTVMNDVCLDVATATSNTINMTVYALPNPSIAAAATSCQNANITYTTQLGYNDYDWTIPGVQGTDYTIVSGGDGSNTLQVTWLTAGSKEVAVNYTNNGCYAANPATSTTTVNPATVVTSITEDYEVCHGATAPQYIEVQATGTGTLSYYWEYSSNGINWGHFADMTSATYDVLNHGAYSAPGTLYYRCTVTSDCGSDVSDVMMITVNPLPSLSVTTQPTAVCFGNTVNLTTAVIADNNSTGAGTYTYYSDMALQNVVANPNSVAAGTYYVTRTVTATGCVSASVALTATVHPLVVPTITGNDLVAAYDALDLETEGGKSNYTWTAEDAISIQGQGTANATITWDQNSIGETKIVTVTYTETNSCVGTSANFLVEVEQGCEQIVIGTHPTAAQTVCEGSDVTLSVVASAGSEITYQWYKENGVVDIPVGTNSNSLSINDIAATSTYYVKLINSCTNGGAGVTSNNAVITVTPNVTPSVSIALTGGTNPTCLGEELTFTASPINEGVAPTYQWYINNTPVDGEVNSTFTTDTYTNGSIVKVVLTSSILCVTSQTATSNEITISAAATPSLTITNPSAVCAPTTVNLTAPAVTAGSSNVTTKEYYPTLNDAENGTNALTAPSAIAVSGIYFIKAINNTNCYDIAAVVVRIDNGVPAQPSAITGLTSVSAGDNGVTYSVDNVANVTYTWSYSGTNATIASGQGTNSISVNYAGNATSGTWTVTPSNTCGNGLTRTTSVVVLAGEPTIQATMSLYSPNPGAMRIIIPGTANGVGYGNRRLIAFAYSTNDMSTGIPVDGTEYTASPVYGVGQKLKDGGDNGTFNDDIFVVDVRNVDAVPDTIIVSGLFSRTSYKIAVYDYNTVFAGLNPTPATNNYNEALAAINTGGNHRSATTMRKLVEPGQEQYVAQGFEVCQIAPNPAKEQIGFCINAIEDNDFTIELYTTTGERVYLQKETLTAGTHTMDIQLSSKKGKIAAGMYILKITSGDETLSQPVVVMP